MKRYISDGSGVSLKSCIWFVMGVVAVLAMLFPYIVLKENAIVMYHDQLDGEMISYILQAKYLFQGNMLPEFMGGMEKTSLVMPAPMCVLLFVSGNYFGAYVCMQLSGSLTGFLGMYLLGRDLTQNRWIGMIVGILFAYLPFRPVYGLSQYGMPLLIWCFWQMTEKKKVILCTVYCIMYAFNSSLVLVGFAVLGGMFLGILFQRHGSRKYVLRAWILMMIVYVVENGPLLFQILGIDGTISHKAEYVLSPKPFLDSWWTAFVNGDLYIEDFHRYILLSALALLAFVCLTLIIHRNDQDIIGNYALTRKLFPVILLLLGINLLLAFVSAFWGALPGIALRNRLHALRGFQLGRVLWIAPALWYVMLSCILGIGAESAERMLASIRVNRSEVCKLSNVGNGLITFIITAALFGTAIQVLYASNLKPNLQKMADPDYSMISYGDYYALGVMEQVKDYLTEVSGQNVSQYRVVSLGIDPAAAYYAGFYCLDGYSNNYSLDYKHEFRKVLTPELKKSDYLAQAFDNWGNRCYLFSAECPGYYTIEKNGFHFQDYDIDTQALAELGGRYLLSAAYIMNSEEKGLYLLREEAFELPDSYYRIFVYEVVTN